MNEIDVESQRGENYDDDRAPSSQAESSSDQDDGEATRKDLPYNDAPTEEGEEQDDDEEQELVRVPWDCERPELMIISTKMLRDYAQYDHDSGSDPDWEPPQESQTLYNIAGQNLEFEESDDESTPSRSPETTARDESEEPVDELTARIRRLEEENRRLLEQSMSHIQLRKLSRAR